jgi:hypothetical protein
MKKTKKKKKKKKKRIDKGRAAGEIQGLGRQFLVVQGKGSNGEASPAGQKSKGYRQGAAGMLQRDCLSDWVWPHSPKQFDGSKRQKARWRCFKTEMQLKGSPQQTQSTTKTKEEEDEKKKRKVSQVAVLFSFN